MSNKIMVADKDKIMCKDKNVAEIMNNYSLNITNLLKIIKNSNSNDIMKLIPQLNDHVSINKIKGRYLQIILYAFTFNQASLEDVQKKERIQMLKNHPQVN